MLATGLQIVIITVHINGVSLQASLCFDMFRLSNFFGSSYRTESSVYSLFYFNTCTVHFLLFRKITNKSTITINL